MIAFCVLFFGVPVLAVIFMMATARPGYQDENGFHEGEKP